MQDISLVGENLIILKNLSILIDISYNYDKVKIKCLWGVADSGLVGFFLVSFFWKITSEGNS